MMYTMDRIERLALLYGVPCQRLTAINAGAHDILDRLDKAANINTRWDRDMSRHFTSSPKVKPRYVGERVRLHEHHTDHPTYFWLGADAETEK